jgi:hypothetical protein
MDIDCSFFYVYIIYNIEAFEKNKHRKTPSEEAFSISSFVSFPTSCRVAVRSLFSTFTYFKKKWYFLLLVLLLWSTPWDQL